MTDRRVFLELAKIAKERGRLTPTLLRVYLKNMVIAYKREKAAEATAATLIKTITEIIALEWRVSNGNYIPLCTETQKWTFHKHIRGARSRLYESREVS
ncbi:hypothetical protein MT396_09975 [Paenibacillus polymyxa]|uniref:hypothetical protein n=1 Tax=Paenibacillus polymyxa TaxID=1406 RepID=UPI001FB2EDE2|nr:hypothetical protein [Paenibacillus polymyxa]MCJ1220363.1 hypothetical protein [Paenibacillus polymyxa]